MRLSRIRSLPGGPGRRNGTATLLALVAGVGMVLNGLAKVVHADRVAERMAEVHVTGLHLTLQGILEVALGVATVLPRTRNAGLIGLMGVLVGAVGAHMGAGQPASRAIPAVVALLITTAAFVTRNSATVRRLVLGSQGE